MMEEMTGAECLLRTLLNHSIDTCFMNPGTSEMQFVSALDRVPAMQAVLCLQEAVCAGAADGYARMKRRPAATLLHLGPGLANGLSNFHNARKARSPVVSIVGQHSTAHLAYDAPLTADIEAVARPFSSWVRTLGDPLRMGAVAAEAIQAARTPPGQVATLIVPADHSWSTAGEPSTAAAAPKAGEVDAAAVANAACVLRRAAPGAAALLLSGDGLLPEQLNVVARIATAAPGARFYANRYAGRLHRGQGVFFAPRVPYFPEHALEMLNGIEDLILVSAQPPVSFFGYPNQPSLVSPPGCRFHTLAAEGQDVAGALELLAEQIGAPDRAPAAAARARPELPAADSALTADAIGRILSHRLPDGAILSDEMVSSGEFVHSHLAAAARHDNLPVTGGSIGQGLPVALGAAMAEPNRKVVALEADGSGLYSLQALWTMARHSLDVVVIVLANRRYRILEVEMDRTGAGPFGPNAARMIDLSDPPIDWVALARAQSVEAAAASTAGAFADLLSGALRRRGPFLIEASIG